MKKYEIQVVALQEIKHAGNEITNFRKCTMFNSNGKNRT